jgi:hypothetical protein
MKTQMVSSNGKAKVLVVVSSLVLALLLVCAVAGFTALGNLAGGVLADNLSAPLDGATAATVDISTGAANLTIDRLAGGEELLANGTLQYTERQGVPVRSVDVEDGRASLTLRDGDTKQSWFRLPWAACTQATEWQIHLNPNVQTDVSAHSGGGNLRMDLTGMDVTRLAADTGGGNVDVVLPDHAANLDVTAKTGAGNVAVEVGRGIAGSSVVTATTGAGNVTVRVPNGVAAKVHATSGIGKVTMDSRFVKLDGNTYQSPDYDGAANRVEITVSSGAGNVSVNTL